MRKAFLPESLMLLLFLNLNFISPSEKIWVSENYFKCKKQLHSGCTHTKQFVPCPSMFDPQSPVCLTIVSTPYHAQSRYTFLALARLKEVFFGTVWLFMHEHNTQCRQEVTVLRASWGCSNLSAGQLRTGEEGQSRIGTAPSKWAKCECARTHMNKLRSSKGQCKCKLWVVHFLFYLIIFFRDLVNVC